MDDIKQTIRNVESIDVSTIDAKNEEEGRYVASRIIVIKTKKSTIVLNLEADISNNLRIKSTAEVNI